MIIKNARVFTEDGNFMQGDVVVKDGRFDSVLERTADTDAANDSASQEIIDASGLIMIPGLVDIHFHGCKGADMKMNINKSGNHLKSCSIYNFIVNIIRGFQHFGECAVIYNDISLNKYIILCINISILYNHIFTTFYSPS